MIVGVYMESANDFLKQINEVAGESAEILKKTYNEVNATYELLEPRLIKMIKDIRGSRMAIVTELKTTLATMKDVRKFFLESDYKKEIERLERFVVLCERMKILIDDGTIEAVCDIALKFAIGNEEG
jgi:hypothetical protein